MPCCLGNREMINGVIRQDSEQDLEVILRDHTGRVRVESWTCRHAEYLYLYLCPRDSCFSRSRA